MLTKEEPGGVYISGPMTGIAYYNIPLFMKAERMLKEYEYCGDFHIVNPVRLSYEAVIGLGITDAKYEDYKVWSLYCDRISKVDYMRADKKSLADCTDIVFLPGWEESEGAKEEYHDAQLYKMGMWYYTNDWELVRMHNNSTLEALQKYYKDDASMDQSVKNFKAGIVSDPVDLSSFADNLKLGTKFDTGKPRFSLLELGFIEEMIGILEYGAKVHGEKSWQKVPNGLQRYSDAGFRHYTKSLKEEDVDSETGLSHEAAEAVNAMFRWWFRKNGAVDKSVQ